MWLAASLSKVVWLDCFRLCLVCSVTCSAAFFSYRSLTNSYKVLLKILKGEKNSPSPMFCHLLVNVCARAKFMPTLHLCIIIIPSTYVAPQIDFFPFGGVGCRPPRTCCRLSTDLLSRLTFSSSLFSKSSTAGWKWSQKKHYSGFPKIWNWDSASLAFLSLPSFATLTEIWPEKPWWKRQGEAIAEIAN